MSSPVCATGVSLLARGCLSGATPRGEPWTSAGTLPQGRSGLNARRMAVLETCRAPSLCRHVHRAFLRSVGLDVTPRIAATACHQSNDVERYSRFMELDKSGRNEQVPKRADESIWAGVGSSPLAGPTPVFGGGSESGGDRMANAVYKALVANGVSLW